MDRKEKRNSESSVSRAPQARRENAAVIEDVPRGEGRRLPRLCVAWQRQRVVNHTPLCPGRSGARVFSKIPSEFISRVFLHLRVSDRSASHSARSRIGSIHHGGPRSNFARRITCRCRRLAARPDRPDPPVWEAWLTRVAINRERQAKKRAACRR